MYHDTSKPKFILRNPCPIAIRYRPSPQSGPGQSLNTRFATTAGSLPVFTISNPVLKPRIMASRKSCEGSARSVSYAQKRPKSPRVPRRLTSAARNRSSAQGQASSGAKERLILRHRQATLTPNGRSLGECRFK
jgi:hypothetical protein